MARILIVDDERHIRQILQAFLVEHHFDVLVAESGEEGLELAARTPPDLALLDLMLGGLSGLDTFKRLRERLPEVPCIFMTGYGSIRSAVDAMRAGGDDYLTKPFDNDELLIAVKRALELRRLSREVEELRNELSARYGFDNIVGISRPMQEVFRIMKRLADKEATVLILGESGTGKELVARALHQRSPRRAAPFVAVNCSAIPTTLVEAEFFGYERGAFTDAREAHAGKFEQAHRGTLFLDEVGDLPTDAQAKLLRVLQDREVTRLGARKAIKVDVRVLAATNKNLEAAVRTGQFREDLFWRLNVLSLRLPPLRDRPEDLPLLIDAFIQQLAQQMDLPVNGISPEARRLLLAHDWPGNVRELENTLQRAMVLCEGTQLLARDLPPRIRGNSSDDSDSSLDNEKLSLGDAVRRATERVERAWIQAALSEHRGSRTATATSLGINRKTLFNKMRLFGLVAEGETEPD